MLIVGQGRTQPSPEGLGVPPTLLCGDSGSVFK